MDKIGILDFGGQYTQLIARRIRELGVYSEILPCTQPLDEVLAAGYQGLVLSGGPSSVYEEDAPLPDKKLFEAGVPLLGICYGMQAMGYRLGGHVVPAERREYGAAQLKLEGAGGLLDGVEPERDDRVSVWMSHGDTVMKPPRGFVSLASTENCPVAAMADRERKFFAVQFHPEVAHTPQGKTVLENFLRVCGARGDWSMPSFVDAALASIRRQVGTDRVLCALSGGVDSSVVAVLIHRAVGDQLTCLFVDNGLLRAGEAESVVKTFRDAFKIHLVHVDASRRFLGQLRGVTDPETKRKRIGTEFIAVFEEEVRAAGLERDLWQAFAVLLPVKTVGVMGDFRTYSQVIALRAVMSQDAMTADWARLPYELLGKISNRIINEVKGVNRVVFDISSKPPSTIEWE